MSSPSAAAAAAADVPAKDADDVPWLFIIVYMLGDVSGELQRKEGKICKKTSN